MLFAAYDRSGMWSPTNSYKSDTEVTRKSLIHQPRMMVRVRFLIEGVLHETSRPLLQIATVGIAYSSDWIHVRLSQARACRLDLPHGLSNRHLHVGSSAALRGVFFGNQWHQPGLPGREQPLPIIVWLHEQLGLERQQKHDGDSQGQLVVGVRYPDALLPRTMATIQVLRISKLDMQSLEQRLPCLRVCQDTQE